MFRSIAQCTPFMFGTVVALYLHDYKPEKNRQGAGKENMRITYRYKNCEIDQDLKDYLSVHITRQIAALSESDGWNFNFIFEQLAGRSLVIAQVTTPESSLIQVASEENQMPMAIYKVISELKLQLRSYESRSRYMSDMQADSIDATFNGKKVSRYVPLSKFDRQRVRFQENSPGDPSAFSFSGSNA